MSRSEEFFDDEEVTVTLNLDCGDVDCTVITVFTADGKDYIALLPENGPDAGDGSVYIYRYSVNELGEPELGYIDDDDEYEAASDAFDEYLDSAEFDELVTEDELADEEE